MSSVRLERTLPSPSCWCLLPLGYEDMEPPSGADPDLLPYGGRVAAVRGGVAGHPGLEPGSSGFRARRVCRIPLMAIECGRRLVAPTGSDPASAAFQAAANPSQLESHQVGKQGLEPRPPGPKPGALTLTLHPGELEI